MTDVNGVVTEGGMASTPAEGGDSSAPDVNWSDMALEIEGGDDGDFGRDVEGDAEVIGESENSSDDVPPTPAASPAPASVPQGTEAPPSPGTQTPPVVPAAQPAPPSPTPSQEPPAQPNVPYTQWRETQVAGLEKFYTFDDETSAQLLSEPEVVLPKLAAKLHMEVVEHVMRSVATAMPRWIEGVQQSQMIETTAENAFYGANPDLKDPAYRNVVLQMGMAYRQMNPSAPAEEAVKVIGNMVRSVMGLTSPAPLSADNVTPAAPQAASAGVFIPARGGGGGAVPVQTSNNPWASLAEEFLTE